MATQETNTRRGEQAPRTSPAVHPSLHWVHAPVRVPVGVSKLDVSFHHWQTKGS